MQFKVPIVVIIYNRPDNFRQLWQSIRQIQPAHLFVISDGPKTTADARLVEQCRALATPDWECTLVRIYAAQNLGCRESQIRGLSRVFAEVERAIVLEDDCIPHHSFFDYCSELLDFYSEDKQIFSITGLNQWTDLHLAPSSWSFSRYFCSWGWASWRRSWQLCNWDERVSRSVLDEVPNSFVLKSTHSWWIDLLRREDALIKMDSWAYQFCLAGLRRSSWTVIPRRNLIANTGLANGTHFKDGKWILPPVEELDFPLYPASIMELNDNYDRMFERRHFDMNPMRVLRRKLALGRRIRKLLGLYTSGR